MGKEVLVEVNIPDTDELRLKKINRNFQFLFKLIGDDGKPKKAVQQSQQGSTATTQASQSDSQYMLEDEAYQAFATQDDIDTTITDLKEWLASDIEFREMVSGWAEDVVETDVNEGGKILALVTSKISEYANSAPKIACGKQATTIDANSYTDMQIKFGKTFASTPIVTCNVQNSKTAHSRFIGCEVFGATTTGCSIRVFNTGSKKISPHIAWIAVQA